MSPKTRALLGALLLGTSAWPVLAQAEHAPPPTTVDSIIVTGAREPEDPPMVAAARKTLSETPGAVTVISNESYAKRFAIGLDDMLRDAPGVYAQRKWGGDIRISIRGSGVGNANHLRGLLIAQDGVPLNEADGFGDTQISDPLNSRFTEIYRGGNALRFGGALLGGAINTVTPTGRDAGFDNQARVDGGAYGLLREHVALARVNGDWDVFVAATNQTGQGYRPQSQQNLQFGALNIGRSFGEDREIRFIINGSNINQEIPGALTLAQFRANPRQPAPANYANDQGRNQRGLRGSLRTTWRFSDSVVFQGAAYAVWKDLDHPIFQVIDQQSRNYGLFARFDWEGSLGDKRADAYFGTWLRTGDLDSNFYVNAKGARGAPTSRTLQNADATDVFGEGRLFLTRQFALVAGATWGSAGRDYRQFAIPGSPATFNLKASKDYDWVAPRLGLLWENAGGDQVFANITKSVEPPNQGSLSPTGSGFAPVRPQKAWTAELGTRGRQGPLTWDVTVYHARLDDELLQFTVAPNIPASTFNAQGRTVHQGIEATLDWRIVKPLRLRQTYTLSDFHFENDSQYRDNRLPIVPKHFYRAELRYNHPAGWFVAPSVEVSSDLWVDFANTTRSPSYTILNLNAGWSINDRVSLFVDARNLTDQAYVSNVQAAIRANAATAAYWPGDGRSLFAGISLTF